MGGIGDCLQGYGTEGKRLPNCGGDWENVGREEQRIGRKKRRIAKAVYPNGDIARR
jgi:hypothetical protein